MQTIRKRRRRNSPPLILFDEIPCPRSDLKGPCHIFRGGKYNGYGRVWNGKNQLVHVYVWEKKNGPIPKGLVLDHQCTNRACCNIHHLRAVTQKVNTRENVNGHPWQKGRAMTHCKRGHEFSKENTRVDKRGCRVCKTCERLRNTRNL